MKWLKVLFINELNNDIWTKPNERDAEDVVPYGFKLKFEAHALRVANVLKSQFIIRYKSKKRPKIRGVNIKFNYSAAVGAFVVRVEFLT